MKNSLLIMLLVMFSGAALGGNVSVLFARFQQQDGGWKVAVTLRHADAGWDHYANAWRIVDDKGTELGRRVLAHPHTEEQPFTRSLFSAKIPRDTRIVYIEASDTVHGWSSDRIRLDLTQASGERFQVKNKIHQAGDGD